MEDACRRPHIFGSKKIKNLAAGITGVGGGGGGRSSLLDGVLDVEARGLIHHLRVRRARRAAQTVRRQADEALRVGDGAGE